ncbi:MAG: protein translocase subunit SecF [Candidatus Nealsonbacteria bacterium]|nr:MAG: protein translocase subunit SecF [Candidatus Nealsonbacteria bacterium]
MINFIKYRKIYFIFSAFLVLGSLFCLTFFGLKFGIDFTGGTVLELQFADARPQVSEIKQSLSSFNLGEAIIQPSGQKGVLIRTGNLSQDMSQKIIQALKERWKLDEKQFKSRTVGPSISKELRQKTRIVTALAVLAILLYITYAFRKLTYPVKSWQYALAAIFALFHDVLIPTGIFSLLGKFYGVPFTIPIVTALLTVFGYSINDSVVVFDRIRENLLTRKGQTFEETVNKSLNQTLARSFNTSFTTLLVLFAIFFFGGETLRYFSLTLIIGIASGTYSSIFLTSPILVSWLKKKGKI